MTQTDAMDGALDGAIVPGMSSPRAGWIRYLPIAVVALGAVVTLYFFGDLFSFGALKQHREMLFAWRDQHYALTVAAFFAIYVALVAFSIPFAVWMTLAGGFMFGVVVASALIVTAATLGASALFLAARSSFGALLKERAGPWLGRIEAGVRANAVSYMLILRLAPAVPFFAANLAPAFLGVPFRTFFWTTFVGIIPGTVVYCFVGAGLGQVIDAGGEPELGVIFEPHVLIPLLGLAALSALPILLKALRRAPPVEPGDPSADHSR